MCQFYGIQTCSNQIAAYMQTLWRMGGGAEKVLASLQSSLLMCPYFLMSSLNVLFLKEVPKNAHERQQAKSRIS